MRLIDADALKEKMFIANDNWNPVVTEIEIDEAPTVEARPVVRGEWNEYEQEYNAWQCSECGKVWLLAYGTPKENEMNYCTKCGADMRKKVE